MKFYVYKLIDPETNIVFYIGKGTKSRYKHHLSPGHLNKNTFKANKIRAIITKGLKPVVNIVFETNNEIEAFAKEVELIQYYGRRDIQTGILCNMTDGGEGLLNLNVSLTKPNYTHSTETRNKIKAAREKELKEGRLYSQTEQHRVAISKWSRQHWADMSESRKREIIEKKRQKQLGVPHTLERKQKISNTHKSKNLHPWENTRISNNQEVLDIWKQADVIYDIWIDNNKCSAEKLSKLTKIKCSRLMTMRSHFLKSWNPHIDESFQLFRTTLSY